jgi:hypothetical protein
MATAAVGRATARRLGVRLNDYGLRYVVKCVPHTMWSVRSGHCGLTSRMREVEKEDA